MAADVKTDKSKTAKAKRSSGVVGPKLVPPVIAKAIVEIQKTLKPMVKSAENSEYGSSYVPLDDVMDKAIELLSGHKIAVMQPAVTDQNDHLALKTMLVHVSGVAYAETSRLALPKPDPQGHASSITYARRNNLMAMLGLTAKNEDDDGNKASGILAKVSDEQRERLQVLLTIMSFPTDEIARITRNTVTADAASLAIIKYEKMASERMREREAEKAALDVEKTATHIPVTDDPAADRTLKERLEKFGFRDNAAIREFIFETVEKPFLKNCTPDDMKILTRTLDRVESGDLALPDEWAAAGEWPTKDTADADKKAGETTP